MRNTIILATLALAACNGDKGFVTYNNPPAVTIIEPFEGSVFNEGDPVEFLGQASDEGDLTGLTVEWISSIDGVLPDNDPPDSDGVVEFVSSILSAGTHVITLRAVDPGNEQGEATVQIEVVDAPDAPNLVITNPPPSVSPPVVGIEGVPFTFGVQVSDADTPAEQLVVELNSNPGGMVCFMVPDVTGTATCSSTLALGNYLLTFTVEDEDGNTTARNVTFDVRDAGDVDQDGDGHTPNGGDCNDSAVTVYPGAPEVCDGLDNDCNPLTAIDVNSPCYDDDGDGFCEGPPCTNTSNTQPDCDDASPLAYPGNTEICDGIDNDCVNGIDNGFNSLPYYIDFDADGYGAEGSTPTYSCESLSGQVTNDYDCNDLDNRINIDAVEDDSNGIDDDCDGLVDEGGANFDDDGDGYCEGPPCTNVPGGSLEQDCDDNDASINPGAPEICGDGVDNNCDFDQNDENALGCTVFYQDSDGDGYGTSAGTSCRCEPTTFPYTGTTSTDCDDSNAVVNPGQTNFFSSPANGSFDYNCDFQEERQYTTASNGCAVAGLGCNGTTGWIGGIPTCGGAGSYQADCNLDIPALVVGCGFPCGVTCLQYGLLSSECIDCIVSVCPAAQVCDSDGGGPSVQSCR